MSRRNQSNKLEERVEKVRNYRLANYQEERNIADILLEEDLNRDSRDFLIYTYTLLRKIDILLGILEKIGNSMIEFEMQRHTKTLKTSQ
jgi:hypothetical protein